MLDNNKIVHALRSVQDPNSKRNIIDAGIVSDFRIEGTHVSFVLNLPKADSRLKGEVHFTCIRAIQDIYPKAEVHVHMKSEDTGLNRSNLPHVHNIVAVASGKGGVGKSTVSVNLAVALQKQGFRVGLLDADLYGPSIPTMLGLRGQKPVVKNVYGKSKIEPLVQFGLYVMSLGFIIEPEQAVVLRGPRLAGIIKQFLQDCLWPELDFMIVDLPPGTGDIQLTLVQSVAVTGAIMVTTPQDVAVADAVKAMNMFRLSNINVPILGVIENMSWFTPAELPDHKYFLFGAGGGETLAKQADATLLGQIPLIQSIRESGDTGRPYVLSDDDVRTVAFQNIAQNLVAQVAHRNAHQSPTQQVNVS